MSRILLPGAPAARAADAGRPAGDAALRPWLPLWLRLWIAVVLAVALLILLVALAWRYSSEPPLRSVVVRDAAGQIVGRGHSLRAPRAARDKSDGNTESDDEAPPERAGLEPALSSAWGPGPVFVLQMDDGAGLYYLHLPRPDGGGRSFWTRAPFGFLWMLGLVGLGVALATYPIVRKLTRGLNQLHASVRRWGAGDLSARAPVLGSDEAALLALRFNDAAERIEALIAAHKSLLANASHELRSPLARIRMGLELLATSSAPAGLRDEIARNIGELDQLIDEILLSSRLQSHEADIGSVETIDLAGLAAEECARIGEKAELELDPVQHTVLVRGVSRLLRRMVRNLLENARRYGGGSPVRLALRAQGARVRLSVSDRGPGVAPSERERIFEPFYRAAGASERDGGVGLGLALVRSIARRHGGEVRCEANEGGGARFVVELPRARD